MGRLEICWRLKSRKPWEEPRLTFRNPCSFLAGHQIQLEAIRRVWGKGVRVRVTPQESIISTDCNPSFVRRYVRGGEADVCEAWNFPRASSIPIGIGPNGIEAALSPMLVNDRFFFLSSDDHLHTLSHLAHVIITVPTHAALHLQPSFISSTRTGSLPHAIPVSFTILRGSSVSFGLLSALLCFSVLSSLSLSLSLSLPFSHSLSLSLSLSLALALLL